VWLFRVWRVARASNRLKRYFYRLSDTPVTATYGASVTTRLRIGLIALLSTFVLMFIGFIYVMGLAVSEEICFDRWPWWGPPENPDVYTSCSGHYYERHHK
jgi:hypothetical protein